VSVVFVIDTFRRARFHRQWLDKVREDLSRGFVHANQRVPGVVRLLVDIKDFFHPRDEAGAVFFRNAEPF